MIAIFSSLLLILSTSHAWISNQAMLFHGSTTIATTIDFRQQTHIYPRFATIDGMRENGSALFLNKSNGSNERNDISVEGDRRNFLGMLGGIGGMLLVTGAPAAVWADPTSTSTTASTATIYKSGKMPIVPGGKPREKGDVKGSRKDPDFLRSIADCRSQCQSTTGPDGYSRAKEDCLSECQDICCKTYEQCTFDIVPRI